VRQFVKASHAPGKALPRTPLRAAKFTVQARRTSGPSNHLETPASTRDLTAAERRQTALDLRIQGHSLKDIADAVGVSFGRVSDYINDALADISVNTAASAEKIRAFEIERLNRLVLAHWSKRHQLGAAALIVRFLERLHKIQGLEVTKHEVSGLGGGPVTIALGMINISLLTDEEVGWLEKIVMKGCPALPAPAPVGQTYENEAKQEAAAV
jgi:predicted transcriptional regulator